MPRQPRIIYPGVIYHITTSSKPQQKIFQDEKDYMLFLSILKNVIHRYNWNCHAYCLMPEMYHILVETPLDNLSLGMRQLNGVYTQRYNKRHTRQGSLFQGRFKSAVLQKEKKLVDLFRAVLRHPVQAGLVKKPSQWPWSSYRSMVGKKGQHWITLDNWLLTNFGSKKAKAMERFKVFMQTTGFNESEGQSEPLNDEGFMRKLKGYAIGPGEVLDKMMAKEAQDSAETPPQLGEIFKKNQQNKSKRNKAIYKAHKKYGYTLTDIGKHLDLHCSTISKVFKGIVDKKMKKK